MQLSLTSPDGDQGYPGEVHVSVSYTLRVNDSLQGQMRQKQATVTQKPKKKLLKSVLHLNVAGFFLCFFSGRYTDC